MFKNALVYTGKKSKKCFFVLFYIVLLQTALVQIVSKLLMVLVGDKSYLAYQVILAVITSPLQIGFLRIIKCLHEDHRFRPNLLFYDYGGFVRLFKALALGVLNSGLQTAVNIISQYTGSVTAGGAATLVTTSNGLAKMPFITGMLSAALTIFIFMINYIYVNDDKLSIPKVWTQSFKLAIHNIPLLAIVIVLCAAINYFVCQIIIDLTARLFVSIGFVGAGGNITITIIAYMLQSLLVTFISVFQYGIARQILGDTKEELLCANVLTESENKSEK